MAQSSLMFSGGSGRCSEVQGQGDGSGPGKRHQSPDEGSGDGEKEQDVFQGRTPWAGARLSEVRGRQST